MTRRVLLALALAAIAPSACWLRPHTCPQIGQPAIVAIPAAQSSPIARTSTSGPCSAWDANQGSVAVARTNAGSCDVLVTLMDGDVYIFSVGFSDAPDVGDCTGGARSTGSTDPVLVDGGVDRL